MCGGGGGYEEKEPASKLALAEQAANSLKRYGEIFVPLENAYIQDNLNAFGNESYGKEMGQISNQTLGLYEQKLPEYESAIFNSGIDPTSGAYGGKMDSIYQAASRSVGQGAANAGLGQTDKAYQGLSNVVRAGQGLQAETIQSNVGRLANQMDLASDRADKDFASRSSTNNIAGTVAGAGAGIYYNSGGG